MQIENLHEMLKPNCLGNKKKYFKISSAEIFTQKKYFKMASAEFFTQSAKR